LREYKNLFAVKITKFIEIKLMRIKSDLFSNNLVFRIKNKLGLNNDRNLYWSMYEPKNFGDWITPYLFKKITGKTAYFCPPGLNSRMTTIFGAGSILRHHQTDNSGIIWGSGIISSDDSFKKPRDIRAVRGPLSRARCIELGYDCPENFGDPAILLPDYYQPKASEKHVVLGIIPHYINYDIAVEIFGHLNEIKIIDVTKPIEEVVDDISCCHATISGSLHGLIVSHCYGVSSTWVEFGNKLMGDQTKFLDYFQSWGEFEIKDPVLITKENSKDELIEIANHNKVPDLQNLRESLMSVCPF
jgi:pyruvyltransferase